MEDQSLSEKLATGQHEERNDIEDGEKMMAEDEDVDSQSLSEDELMQEEIAVDNEEVLEVTEHETSRLKSLKASQNQFADNLKKSNKKKSAENSKDPQERMKELISQAEKLASFLLSKHKMHAHDPREKQQIRRKKTKSVSKEDISQLL